jgi:hypothetical protein
MKITIKGNTSRVTSACISKDKHGYKLLVNTSERWREYQILDHSRLFIHGARDDDNSFTSYDDLEGTIVEIEFDSLDFDFTARSMTYHSQEKDQIELRWLSVDGMLGVQSTLLLETRFDGGQQ